MKSAQRGMEEQISQSGIGGTFSDSNNLGSQPSLATANFFNHDNSGSHPGHDNGINVDNIFASMTGEEDDRVDFPGDTNFNINFASVTSASKNSSTSSFVMHNNTPPRKYSDQTDSNRQIPFSIRSESNDLLLSKSMGNSNTSLLRLASRHMTDCESDPTPTIRFAGYLLKRSNMPYVPEQNEYLLRNIAPLPDLTDLNGDSDHLSMGGVIPCQGGVKEGILKLERSSTLFTEQLIQDTAINVNFLDATTSATSDNTKILSSSEGVILGSFEEEVCLCSPFAKFIQQIFDNKRPSNALTPIDRTNGGSNGGMLDYKIMSSHIESPMPMSTKQVEIPPPPPRTPIINQYTMSLKSPARSNPIAISPSGKNNTTFIPRPRSFSTTTYPIAANAAAAAALSSSSSRRRKEHPPPPPDYIDPKDGHLWRSKYCILEEGILYFYCTAEEGESIEAQRERYEQRLYSEELEDIVLGEEFVVSSPKRSSSSSFESKRWSGITFTENNRMSSRDIYDLSKSPTPQRKSNKFGGFQNSPFHRQGSSINVGSTSNFDDDVVCPAPAPERFLRQSSSFSTFQNDADILWEKRVALDCVGAVRSSQDHGTHSFELLAYGCDGPDDDTASTAFRGGGGRKDDIIDRLILRASSSDDRNDWMFQFHRSLTSFVMQKFVNKGLRPDSPCSRGGQQPFRLPSGGTASSKGGSIVSPFVAKSCLSGSPTGNNSFGAGPSFVGSLSHGHGRNALYRRKVRDGKSVGGDASVASLLSPRQASNGISRESSSSEEFLMPSTIMIQSDSSIIQKKVELPSLKGLRVKDKQRDGDKSLTNAPAVATTPQKYIPPHMRIPVSGVYDVSVTAKKMKEDYSLSMNNELMEKTDTDKTSPITPAVSSETLGGSLSDSPLCLLDDSEDYHFTSISIRRGGCADPKVVVGSIIDDHYIDRKASVVGNARLDAYAGKGGGYYRRMNHLDDSLVLDEIGVNRMLEPRTVALKWEVGASSECGVRNSNEDSYVAVNNLDDLMKAQGFVSFSEQDLGQTKQQGLYAIFDGHVGNQAARFAAERLPDLIMEEESVLASRDSACLSSIEERADKVLREAFDRLDREFCTLCTKDGRDWDSGSTALVALIVDDVVSLANLGDCRGVVCRLVSECVSESEIIDGWETLDGHDDHIDNPVWDRASGGGNGCDSDIGKLIWKEMTSTHSPLLDEERERIEKANGWIIQETEIPIGQLHRMDIFDEDVVEIVKRCFADRMKQHRSDPVRQIQIARTCGDLAVSRAIGDRDFKAAYNMPPNHAAPKTSWIPRDPFVFIYPEGHSGSFNGDIVSSVPDVQVFKLGLEPTILIMACDGLWDVMDGDDAARIAKDLLLDKKLSAKDGAARLAELAQHLGSSDNITVILIRFYWED